MTVIEEGGAEETIPRSVCDSSRYGKYSKNVPVSPLTPLGHCSVVYKEILPGGPQTDPASLLMIAYLCCFPLVWAEARTSSDWTFPEVKMTRWRGFGCRYLTLLLYLWTALGEERTQSYSDAITKTTVPQSLSFVSFFFPQILLVSFFVCLWWHIGSSHRLAGRGSQLTEICFT